MAALFSGCAVIYNSVMAAITSSGEWERAVVVATALPLTALLFPVKVANT